MYRRSQIRYRTGFAMALCVALFCTLPAGAEPREENGAYVFSWPFIDEGSMQPRGGTTEGAPVELAAEPGEAWHALHEPGISGREKDRRAILAMAGPYRASFDFLETLGFVADFEPARPYRSWGTEYIYVLADEPDFISLQHIMVMSFLQENGSVSEPLVVKHWRQDWRYEDRDLHVYAGNNRWVRERLSEDAVRGKWSQAVFQVDDSPRYEATGKWTHTGDLSTWESGETWRPLPRREFSVRDDYDVLVGTNRHTIVPSGWVHEEDNLKVVLDDHGNHAAGQAILAREAGVNRYDRIVGYDWSAGDEYWQRTAPYWQQVREAWQDIYRERENFGLRKHVGKNSLFMVLFQQAEATTESSFDAEAARAQIDAVLEDFLTD